MASMLSTTWRSSTSVSVGLVASTRPFRGEVLVSSCEGNHAKLRGTGCAWRSDGLLMSQHAAPGSRSEAVDTWIGRSAPFNVGDELQIIAAAPPDAADLRLFLNGEEVASFPCGALGRSPSWRLAVRVQRSRVTLVEERGMPGLCRLPVRPPLGPEDHPGGVKPLLYDPPTQEDLDHEDGKATQELTRAVETHGRPPRDHLEGLLPRSDVRLGGALSEGDAEHARELFHSMGSKISTRDVHDEWAKRLHTARGSTAEWRPGVSPAPRNLPHTLGSGALDQAATKHKPQQRGITGFTMPLPAHAQKDAPSKVLSARVEANRRNRLIALERRAVRMEQVVQAARRPCTV